MNTFNGSLLLPTGAAKTLQELVHAAITNRTYPTAQAETDAVKAYDSRIVRPLAA